MQVAGLLLTGGASTRMGRDKATLLIDGVTMAAGVARALCAVADPVLVVGHKAGTGLETVEDPRDGPLVALACGRRALLEHGLDVPALVVACDLPFVTREVLGYVASAGAAADADIAVPMLDGRQQSLCAWYAPAALDAAVRLTAIGGRSMKALVASHFRVFRITQDEWSLIAGDDALRDIDSPADLNRF